MRRLVVFTDLDGTLLETGTYDCGPARPVLERLKSRGDRVIAVTSRTWAEVEKLFEEIGLPPAGVVENGSAIRLTDEGGRYDARLGCTLEEAQRAFDALRAELGTALRHLGEIGTAEAARVTGLDEATVTLAVRREFGVVILPAPGVSFATASEAAARLGVRLIEGDRFWHLVGSGADKGRGVRLLRVQLAAEGCRIVGLGNGPSDAGMLEAVDVPFVVPGEHGPHAALASRGWRVAPAPGPAGWAAAITDVLSSVDE